MKLKKTANSTILTMSKQEWEKIGFANKWTKKSYIYEYICQFCGEETKPQTSDNKGEDPNKKIPSHGICQKCMELGPEELDKKAREIEKAREIQKAKLVPA